MGSLTDAYDRPVGNGGQQDDTDRTDDTAESESAVGLSHSRPYLAIGLLGIASAFVVAGVVIATSDTAAATLGLTRVEANELARVLAGVGLPVGFVGVISALVLPRRVTTIGSVGLALSVAGIGGFFWAYPDRWLGDPFDLTLPIVALYAVGFLVSFLSMVVGVHRFGREASAASAERNGPVRDRKNRTSLR